MPTSKRDRNRRWLALSLCLVAFAASAYDTAATRGLGKVHRAIRHNYLPGVGDVVVTEAFDYAGVGGRVSSVRTTNTVNDLEFQTSQTYDALGRVRDLIYPTCLVSASCPSEPLTVRSTYTAHDLTAVGVPGDPDAGASITYHPNGLWSTLTHGNGVVTTQQNDPNSMRRPRRISVSGTVEGTPFDTGLYAYDGAGNVKAMGSDTFVYDPLSRLRESDVHGWEQDFLYDAFGNITRVETTPPGGPQDTLHLPVTAATNRLSSHGYDGAGNLTTFTGWWTQAVDPLNMPIARDSGSGTTWLAVYTASEERLATLDASSGGSSVQHWTLRSPSGQVLRDFRFGLPAGGDAVFCDGFESGDTGGWESTVGVRGPPARPVKGTCGAGSTPEWSIPATSTVATRCSRRSTRGICASTTSTTWARCASSPTSRPTSPPVTTTCLTARRSARAPRRSSLPGTSGTRMGRGMRTTWITCMLGTTRRICRDLSRWIR